MKLGDLQAKSPKKKKQLLASIRKMLKVQKSKNTTSNFYEDLFQNKWFFRKLHELNLIEEMPEGKAKEKKKRDSGGPLKMKIVSLWYLVRRSKNTSRT